MKKIAITLAVSALLNGVAFAQSNDHREAIPHLDHAFVIVMENHHYSQIIGNVDAPFINAYATQANLANNYYGVGHPSLTNYLEIVGGSNFGVINDNSPAWHNTTCVSNLNSNTASLEGAPNICPIAGTGLDGATPAVDTTNEGTPASPIYNFPLAPAKTVGKTIADQLVEAGKSWKTYQENQPAFGADNVNWSDGLLTNTTPAPVYGVPHLYAAKHNPFVYFANIQAGTNPHNSLNNSVGFETLYADLKSGNVPNFSFIAPNQCHDQHGRGSSEVGPGLGYMSKLHRKIHLLVRAARGNSPPAHAPPGIPVKTGVSRDMRVRLITKRANKKIKKLKIMYSSIKISKDHSHCTPLSKSLHLPS